MGPFLIVAFIKPSYRLQVCMEEYAGKTRQPGTLITHVVENMKTLRLGELNKQWVVHGELTVSSN